LLDKGRVRFLLHEHAASAVRVFGSWDGWAEPGLEARELEPGVWQAELRRPAAGRYAYKFQLDGARWLADHANPGRAHDGFGDFNSLLAVG
jgi:1,4-alpha-glucan branching enzyme